VFVLGAANVGKSYFIGSFLEESMGGKPRRLPISSATPGTTLAPVPIDAFGGGSQLYDTPGVHLQHRMSAQLLPRELQAVQPRGRMRPYTPQQLAAPGSTFFWGGLVRFDIREAPSALRLTFCAYPMSVHFCPDVADAEAHYRDQVGVTLTPPLDTESAAELGGLVLRRTARLELFPMEQAADIAISGLGWVSVGCLATLQSTDRRRKAQDAPLAATIDVWAPRGIEVLVRPPMPIAGVPTWSAPPRQDGIELKKR